MENVPGLLHSPELDEIRTAAERLGFLVHSFKACAADFGVPQVRWRAFIVGCRTADPRAFFPPLKTHFDPAKFADARAAGRNDDYVDDPRPWRTVRSAIDDLPPPEGTDMRSDRPPLNLHFGRRVTELSVRRYKAIPEEGMNRFDLAERAPELNLACWKKRTDRGGTDLFGRLWWDQPASTIRTEFWKPEKGRYLHPEQHRSLTLREGARLQAFPDGFIFVGSKHEIGRQIGNAVPPPLASHIADAVAFMLRAGKDSQECPIHSLRSNAAD
jgi:DNA (cytosine-5)-methyltransferase 1